MEIKIRKEVKVRGKDVDEEGMLCRVKDCFKDRRKKARTLGGGMKKFRKVFKGRV